MEDEEECKFVTNHLRVQAVQPFDIILLFDLYGSDTWSPTITEGALERGTVEKKGRGITKLETTAS
jgi:hypothetical protein